MYNGGNGSWGSSQDAAQTRGYGATPLTGAVIHRHKKIIRILVERGADTTGAMKLAERGLAGDFEDLPPPEAYREIIELLRELGVK